MFTGIVEHVGHVMDILDANASRKIRIAAGDFGPAIANGESISVNGVCLTVEQAAGPWFEATAVGETLARTTLGALASGARVNIERAATAATLLGGHIVQGHVDGTGRVVSFTGGAGDRTLTIELPQDVYELCAEKGSIAVDGVSLTIARKLEDRRIEIAIVPYTLEKTIAKEYVPGRVVNLEADVIARYVREQLRTSGEFIGRIQA